MKKEKGREYAVSLVKALKTGTFLKDYRTNHGPDFAEGLEGLHRQRFQTYMGSCGCFLMDQRIIESGSGDYNG